jgi:carboxymethylenebutenolidase
METQGNLVSVPVADGTSMDVVVVQPVASGPWPGILYPFESYGITDHMVNRATATAAEGFVVAIPDLYHRDGRLRIMSYWEFEYQDRAQGRVDVTFPITARERMWNLRNDSVFDDMDAARDYLKSLPTVRADRLGAMGSWMGARIALFYACLRPEIKALVQLYGAGAGSINHWEDYMTYLNQKGEKPPSDPSPAGNKRVLGVVMDHVSKLQAPVLILPTVRGDTRSEESPVEAELRRLGKPFELHEYPNSRNGFDNPDFVGYYNPQYAADAWQRTFAFLKKHLSN